MKHSKYQLAVFDFFKQQPLVNGLINAVAGSGKTYTLMESLKGINTRTTQTMICAFNKAIREEFAAKVPMGVDAFTYNAYGWRICRSAFGNPKMDAEKIPAFLHGSLQQHDFRRIVGCAVRIIGLAKSLMYRQLTDADIRELSADYSIELPKSMKFDQAADIISRAYTWSASTTSIMDFNDQLFMPWYWNLTLPKYDLVLVDEYQDTAPIQSWLMEQSAKNIIVAGDPYQAIYGWRGATPDGLAHFKELWKATELPLSICYRCPKSVISRAQRIVPHIEAAPDAIDGQVHEGYTKAKVVAEATPSCFILSRTAAPLVSACMEFLRANRRAVIRGREFGTDLDNLVNQIATGTPDVSLFLQRLNEHLIMVGGRLQEQGKFEAFDKLEDRVTCLKILAERAQVVADISRAINELFNENQHPGTTINLMTVHKSKGLQADNVFLIGPEMSWDKNTEEGRIHYVAITRAQKNLFIALEPKKKRGGS